MTKKELIVKISGLSGLKKSAAHNAFDAITSVIGEALKNGDSVGIMGFGSFSVESRNAREGRNPKTGAKVQIDAKKVIKFKSGTDLIKTVASEK